VVPVMNARYALNAANARWGSLYDALYGTDAIPEDDGAERAGAYNPVRGARVIAWARDFLDRYFPLAGGSHAQAQRYAIDGGSVALADREPRPWPIPRSCAASRRRGVAHGRAARAQRPARRDPDRPSHPIGAEDAAGVKDLLLESAVSTIQDCEDSVAAVDAEDKALAYRNWLGLMKGDLSESFDKGGETPDRTLNPDRATPRRWTAER
jgi:malate synthase